MAVGAVWMIAFKLADRSLGLVSTLVLARVLVPHDFGIVAMAMSFVTLLELLTAFGFDTALIQKQAKDRVLWDTAWTFNVLFGLFVAGMMVTFAGEVATFYRSIELEQVIRALAAGALVQGFENVGVVAFRTEMRFDREFRFLVTKKIIAFSVTIPAALILDNYWALVIGQVVGKLAGTSLSYGMHPYRPRLTLAAAGSLFHFSKWLLASNFMNYLRERSSDWIIGRTNGATALGTYNIGAEFAALPSTELLAPINRALLPAYSSIKDDPAKMRAEYLSVLSVVVLVGIPAVLGLAATAPFLVPALLGPNWLGVVPVLMILAFTGATNVISGNVYPAYLAMGRPDVAVKVGLFGAILNVVLMLLLAPRYGLTGAAFAALTTSLVVVPVSIAVVIRMLDVRPGAILRAIWRPFVAAAIMYGCVFAFVRQFALDPGTLVNLGRLALAVLLGAAIYVGGVATLWLASGRPHGGETMLWTRGRDILRRARTRLS
ncbi:MAG: lipopolysaccharide biosynthesis protein [Steroidobacteraceae bacterium]